MRTKSLGFLIGSASVLATASAGAQQAAGNPAAGKDFAARSCASCHAVDTTAQTRTDAAPSFPTLANTRSVGSLTGWLMEPHPPMPTLSLTVAQIRDVVAYITSLRAR